MLGLDQPVDIDDYNDLHAFPVRTPESLWDYDEDDAFARQRLQGAFAACSSGVYPLPSAVSHTSRGLCVCVLCVLESELQPGTVCRDNA